jgi:hypothetical protein
LDAGTDNGDNVTVEISLGNYNITSANPNPASVIVYKPVQEDTPEADIDFEAEWLENLTPEDYYILRADEALERKAYAGHISILSGWMNDEELVIIKKGGATTVDSDPQSLTIPARPAMPALNATKQEISGGTGSFTIRNYDSDATYEYRNVNYAESPTDWTDITGDTVSGLSPGAYYVRVKATDGTGGNFRSQNANVRIYAFNEVRFESVLRGYTVDEDGIESYNNAAPQAVTSSDTITDVVWLAGVNELDTSNDADTIAELPFELAGSGENWTVTPKTDLAPGEHTAEIRVKHSSAANEDQIVAIKVYDKVQIASVEAINNAATNITDRIKIEFAYPVNLVWDDVTVTGSVRKDILTPAFATGTDYSTTYTIDVIPQEDCKTGDPITVGISLTGANLGGTYAFQASKTGPTVTDSESDNRATVTIPRNIVFKRLGQTQTYSTGYIQVELTGYPIPPAFIVDYDEPYGGKMTIERGADGGNATITKVIPVTDAPGAVYRVFLSVEQEGTVKLSIPGFGVAAIDVSGIVKGEDLSDAAYFLDARGSNYNTDNEGFQKLQPELDALGAVSAPSYTLRTSEEYGAGGKEVESIYIGKRVTGDVIAHVPLDTSKYTVTGGGGASFIFDGGAPASLTNQLIITLEDGWSGTEDYGDNDYEITVIFKDKADADNLTAALGVLHVTNVTRTYNLTVSGGTLPDAGDATLGRYAAGAPVSIAAPETINDDAKVFSGWTASPADGVFADETATSTIFTMPAYDVEVTAEYAERPAAPTVKIYY